MPPCIILNDFKGIIHHLRGAETAKDLLSNGTFLFGSIDPNVSKQSLLAA